MKKGLAAFVVGLSLVATAAGATGGKVTRSILVPAQHVMLGAFVNPDDTWSGNARAISQTQAFMSLIGRPIALENHYYDWTDTFPSGLEQWDIAHGIAPVITWRGTGLAPTAAGAFDDLIRARAVALRDLRSPVFLRWGWEMNGDWYAHSGAENGGASGPKRFIAAWRHIHDIFTRAGASNVVWVWSPNFESVPSRPWNSFERYYPGDAYVDWVGIDAYNWGATQSWSRWRSLATLIRPIYDAYATRKPIMIGETASAEAGGDKAAWIREAAADLRLDFSDVHALLWFDDAKEADWRVDSSASSLAAFRAVASAPYFQAFASFRHAAVRKP